MKKYGLIGYPLSHSFSRSFFTKKFTEEGLADTFAYENFPLSSIAELPALIINEPQLLGLNVTIP
jgi:shikimate dehydrogenase